MCGPRQIFVGQRGPEDLKDSTLICSRHYINTLYTEKVVTFTDKALVNYSLKYK